MTSAAASVKSAAVAASKAAVASLKIRQTWSFTIICPGEQNTKLDEHYTGSITFFEETWSSQQIQLQRKTRHLFYLSK